MDSTHELAALIERLNSTAPLSPAEAERLHKSALEKAFPKMALGQTYGQAMQGLPILNQDEAAFRAELKSIDGNLQRQIQIVNEALDGWFGKGVSPAPYYAWRIAVILGKVKRKEEEREFLSAWCLHFGNWKGARYEAIALRNKKLSGG
jgi:hypothetical protein